MIPSHLIRKENKSDRFDCVLRHRGLLESQLYTGVVGRQAEWFGSLSNVVIARKKGAAFVK
jgi:hypothetical protein